MTPDLQSGYEPSGPAAEIGLNTENASPPTQTYVGKDDSLWVGAATQNAGLVVTLNARYLMPDGTIQLTQQALRYAQSRQMAYQQMMLPECFLLSVAATCNTPAGGGGSVFITVELSRFAPSLFNASQMLCQGYSTSNQPISWPGGVNSTSVDCAGVIFTAGTSAPGAGNNFSITVPSNAKWRPISMFFTFSASGVAGNRFMVLTIDDGANILASLGNTNAVVAAGVATVTANSTNVGSVPAAGVLQIPLFNGVLLYPAYRIRSAINGLLAGDIISGVSLSVEEWLLP